MGGLIWALIAYRFGPTLCCSQRAPDTTTDIPLPWADSNVTTTIYIPPPEPTTGSGSGSGDGKDHSLPTETESEKPLIGLNVTVKVDGITVEIQGESCRSHGLKRCASGCCVAGNTSSTCCPDDPKFPVCCLGLSAVCCPGRFCCQMDGVCCPGVGRDAKPWCCWKGSHCCAPGVCCTGTSTPGWSVTPMGTAPEGMSPTNNETATEQSHSSTI